MLTFKQKLKLLEYSVGFLVCYTLNGIIVEKIFRGRYGDELQVDGKHGETFKTVITFGALQSIFYTLFAKGLITFF